MLDRPKTIDETGTPSSPRIPFETRRLLTLIVDTPVGTLRTYEDILAETGIDCRHANAAGYRWLKAARDHALREHGIVAEVVDGTGLKICTEAEKVGVTASHVARSHGAVRRAKLVAAAVDTAALTPEERREHSARVSQLGALELFHAPATVARLKTAATTAALPSEEVLKLFSG